MATIASKASAKGSSEKPAAAQLSKTPSGAAPEVAILPVQVTEEEEDDATSVDPNLADLDSEVITSISSSTISLRDSLYAYIEDYGRTYHAYQAGAYHLPNDEAEQERLDLQHHLFVMTMNGALYYSPVTQHRNILDIATGTGRWALEVSRQHPSAKVIGTDLSPIQPRASSLPPNVSFFIEDCETEWSFKQKFDLIHGRALLSCFSKPKVVMGSIFTALEHGGYFELQDILMPCQSPDGTLKGTYIEKWQNLMVQGLKNLGKDFGKVKEYGNYMREAGFVDIVEKKYLWGLGPWMKGKKEKVQAVWFGQNVLDGVAGWSMAIITRGMGLSVAEVESLLEGVRADVRNWKEVHAYMEMYVVYGRKP